MKRALRLLPCLVPAVLGCSELTASDLERLAPTVTVLAATAEPGTVVSLTLENESLFAWTYATCPGRYEHKVGDDWVAVPEPFILCLAVITSIGAQETLVVGAYLSAGIDPGQYRALVPFGKDGKSTIRASNAFTVE